MDSIFIHYKDIKYFYMSIENYFLFQNITLSLLLQSNFSTGSKVCSYYSGSLTTKNEENRISKLGIRKHTTPGIL